MDLAENVIRLTMTFPKTQQYGLTSQLQRCMWSVPSNIAEGHGRGTRRDYCHYVSIAKGSLVEAAAQLELATRVGFVAEDVSKPLLAEMYEIERMLSSLRSRLMEPK